MRRHASPYVTSYSFGPGPLTLTIKAIIAANVALFLAQELAPYDASSGADFVTSVLGLVPESVASLQIWRLVTYMFLHASVVHLLFNMLALWMFGTELERRWGSRYFIKYYFVTGAGSALLTVLFSSLPLDAANALWSSNVIGASGAIYGLLLAFAVYFPERPILLIIFPVPARYFVMIVGLLALYFSVGETSGVANATHLGGIIVGYLYLKGGRRIHPLAELKYRWLKWKINRSKKKFDVYSGGRSGDFKGRVH